MMKKHKRKKTIVICSILMLILIVAVFSIFRYIKLNQEYPSFIEKRIPESVTVNVGNSFEASLHNIRFFSSAPALLKHYGFSEDVYKEQSGYPIKYISADMEFTRLSDIGDIFEGDFVLRSGDWYSLISFDLLFLLNDGISKINASDVGETVTITMVFDMELRPNNVLAEDIWDDIENLDYEVVFTYYPYLIVWEL